MIPGWVGWFGFRVIDDVEFEDDICKLFGMNRQTASPFVEYCKLMGIPTVREEECARQYCHRLEELGFDEVFIGKAMCNLFGLKLYETNALFADFETARIRYIALIADRPASTGTMLARRIARYLDVSKEEAADWVAKFEKTKPVKYLEWFPTNRPSFFSE